MPRNKFVPILTILQGLAQESLTGTLRKKYSHHQDFPLMTLRISSDIGKNCAFAFLPDYLSARWMRIFCAGARILLGANGSVA
jgi:hypothetical protein